ncbi:MAG TPA: hypothetical protein PKY01_19830 [Candidatus Hydrogenedentes bacterium]|nr:hypothetical protein [Candidatus Hydrogenedentota bacterium]
MRRPRFALLLLVSLAACQSTSPPFDVRPGAAHDHECTIATWNVYGYPETDADRRAWFSTRLAELDPEVLCVQEIANQERVDAFLATETGFVAAAFTDSQDGQDNAIFAKAGVALIDLPDPEGFQHPAQAAYVSCNGLDLVIITIHLSWSDKDRREAEKQLLGEVVAQYMAIDPDVMVVGDFNTTEKDIEDLASTIGMVVMLPEDQKGVGTTDGGNRNDHFLISRDLAEEEAVSCRIETFDGHDETLVFRVSDHLPVLARFRTGEIFRDRDSGRLTAGGNVSVFQTTPRHVPGF